MVYPANLNADIMSVICESLDQHSLLALARTAKSLQDPPLRVLWRDIEKFSHLLSLFGSSVNRNQEGISFSSDLTSTQWDRFKFYAKFVRNLRISYEDKIEQSSLLMLLPHQPLLPGLKSLVVYSMDWPDQVAMFFVASIQKFAIYNSRDFLATEQLIRVLGDTAPRLRDLSIGYLGTFTGLSSLHSSGASTITVPEGNEAPRELGGSIPIFHNLCSIEIPLTGVHVHSVLSHLSALPELSRIRFYIIGLARVSDNESQYPFPAARSLSIDSESDDQLMYFMRMTSFNNLTNLGIFCEHYQMDDESLFKAISISCGQFLNKIEIAGDIESLDAVFSFFYPVFKFNNLRSFSLSTQESFWPTSEDIRNIAKSWPNLEEFCVNATNAEGDGEFSPLTWTDLLLLIDECINLKKISISVDALEANIPNVTSSIRRPGLVIEIETSLSSIDSPKALADFLSLALPDADIKAGSELYDCDLWEEALNLRREKLQMVLDENAPERHQEKKPRVHTVDYYGLAPKEVEELKIDRVANVLTN